MARFNTYIIWLRWGFGVLSLAFLCGCAIGDTSEAHGESMSADQLVQTDINRVITLAMRDNLDSIELLMAKLYKRNPRFWREAGFANIDEAIDHGKRLIMSGAVPAELIGLNDIEILSVSLNPEYTGDRVIAFTAGLANMIITAHDGNTRFHISDFVEAKKIFNAARNVEIAGWLLSTRTDNHGQLLLLSNSIGKDDTNLSFEREIGEIIGRLDLVAAMQDENLRRVGINYLQGLLFFNFLPVR